MHKDLKLPKTLHTALTVLGDLYNIEIARKNKGWFLLYANEGEKKSPCAITCFRITGGWVIEMLKPLIQSTVYDSEKLKK